MQGCAGWCGRFLVVFGPGYRMMERAGQQAEVAPDRVVVINDASVARGGATALALLSVSLLAARGLPVTFVCGDDGTEIEGADEMVALGGGRLLQGGRLDAMRRGLFNRDAQALLVDWIARNDTPRTVYHVHGWAQILSPSIFEALQPVAARTVVHAHDFFLVCPNGAQMDFHRDEICNRVPLGAACLATHCDKRSRLQKMWRVARQYSLRRAFDQSLPWAAIAMIHPAMRPILERGQLPGDRLTPLRNPAAPFTKERIRAEDNTGALFVGRLMEEKGVLELARAAQTLGMPLTMVGDGPLREDLARDHPEVTLAGWRTGAEIAEFARSARVLAMPSRTREPFGLVAAEASASGLPIVLPDAALLAEDVASVGLGRSYQTADPNGLVRALEAIRDMPDADIRAMSLRAHAREAPLALTPDDWADAMVGLYRQALATA